MICLPATAGEPRNHCVEEGAHGRRIRQKKSAHHDRPVDTDIALLGRDGRLGRLQIVMNAGAMLNLPNACLIRQVGKIMMEMVSWIRRSMEK